MAQSIPRGIQLVQWKNQDKKKALRYRVRVKRKDYKADRLFITLEQAVDFLEKSKTPEGQKIIESKDEQQDREAKAWMEFLDTMNLGYYIDRYIEKYVDTIEIDSDMRKKNIASIKSCLKTFRNTALMNNTIKGRGFFAKLKMGKIERLEDFKINEITESVINDYIEERLKTVTKATVKQELVIVKKFYSKLRYLDRENFENFDCPINHYDKDLLKNSYSKRYYIVNGNDKEILFKAINEYSNPELRQITMLSFLTAMRRSEICSLKVNQIHLDENYIQLILTKNKKTRRVYLTAEARDIIKELALDGKKPDDNVFKYKLGGFEGSFKNLKKKLGVNHIRFHDLRRTAITNFITAMGKDNSILIAEILGIENVEGMKRDYIDNSATIPTMKTQDDILSTVGHSKLNTTKSYTVIKNRKA